MRLEGQVNGVDFLVPIKERALILTMVEMEESWTETGQRLFLR